MREDSGISAESLSSSSSRQELDAALVDAVGPDHVVRDAGTLARLSGDLSLEPFTVAGMAVAPASTLEVQAVVRAARRAGWSVAARGAAMSYTLGHTPAGPDTLLIDMRRLSTIREIAVRDGYVVAEAGVTWEQLYLDLADAGVRTPYWGPLSGRRATIGGTLSQDSVFFGSARYGHATDAVLCLEIVLADATVVRTGSWSHRLGSPFSRHFGPDLTGMFLGDSGAFGIKTAAVLRTIPLPSAVAGMGFHCSSESDALQVVEDLSRTHIPSDVVAFDPFYHDLLGSLGFTWLKDKPWSVHAVIEGDDQQLVNEQARLLARAPSVATSPLDATVALSLRADPFGATQLMFASIPAGVHLPLHAVLPFTRAGEAVEIIATFLEEFDSELTTHGIRVWQLITLAGGAVVIEPSLYFEGSYRDPLRNGPTGDIARHLRRTLTARLDSLGATHTQLGKYYDFAGALEPASLGLLQTVKHALDPDGTVGPKQLGLE